MKTYTLTIALHIAGIFLSALFCLQSAAGMVLLQRIQRIGYREYQHPALYPADAAGEVLALSGRLSVATRLNPNGSLPV